MEKKSISQALEMLIGKIPENYWYFTASPFVLVNWEDSMISLTLKSIAESLLTVDKYLPWLESNDGVLRIELLLVV